MPQTLQKHQLHVLDVTRRTSRSPADQAERGQCRSCDGHLACAGCTRRTAQRKAIGRPRAGTPLCLYFSEGIDKLGTGMVSLDITPGPENCPCCLNCTCFEVCWARQGNFLNPDKIEQMEMNSKAVRSSQFVSLASDYLNHHVETQAVRIFGAGNPYSGECVCKVREIVQAFPKIQFLTYCHSWPMPDVWEELQKSKNEDNWVIMLSLDRKMIEYYGPPADDDFPRSWLARDDFDKPLVPVHVVWRNRGKNNRRLPFMQTLAGCLVCPAQDGFTKITCIECGICWRRTMYRNTMIAELLRTASFRG